MQRKEATINTFLSVSTHRAEEERLCRFPEPDLGKASSFPWSEVLGGLGMAVLMLTIHITQTLICSPTPNRTM